MKNKTTKDRITDLEKRINAIAELLRRHNLKKLDDTLFDHLSDHYEDKLIKTDGSKIYPSQVL